MTRKENTLNVDEYVKQTASLLNLSLHPDHQPGVVENFTKIMAIAKIVNEFPLPAEVESAPVFKP